MPVLRRIALPAIIVAATWFPASTRIVQSAETPPRPSAKESTPVPLNPQKTVLLDLTGGRLLLKSEVCLREGMLEMLLCRKQSKEHESILAIDSKAYVIHTGLLALKAKPGDTVRFQPEYKPASGQKIDVFLNWTDKQGKSHRIAAQNWIRHVTRRYYIAKMEARPADLTIPEDSELRYDDKHKELLWYGPMTAEQRDALLKLSADAAYQKAIRKFHDDSQPRQMDAWWVFAGSAFYEEKKDGQTIRYYQAEGGDVICVANFPTAMLDINRKSSASGEDNLLYEAWTERIPPIGTEVTIELIPVTDKADSQQQP